MLRGSPWVIYLSSFRAKSVRFSSQQITQKTLQTRKQLVFQQRQKMQIFFFHSAENNDKKEQKSRYGKKY